MKKFLRTLLIFIPLPFLIYALFTCIIGDFTLGVLKQNLYYYPIGMYGHTYSRMEEVRQTKNVDILFLGSSHAYRGFDTRIFKNAGYKAFNLGSSSQTPIETKVLLKRYLKDLNPKTIIYEVFPEIFTMDGVESSLDILANSKNDFNSVRMALKLNNKLTYNALIYSYYRELTGRNKYNEAKIKGPDCYIGGGYVERKGECFKYMEHPTETWKWNEEQFKTFENILSLLKEKNIRVIIVQLPITSSLYNSYTNNEEFDAKMKKYGEYYDFNKIMHMDDSLHFFDDDHLNQDGVTLFNNELLKAVKLN